ncbi:MAG: hypothetical protein ACHQHN_04360 [Sphingobacteriales bacterium]
MKKLILILSIFFRVTIANAQEYVTDPQYTASVIANGTVRATAEDTHNNYLVRINKNLTGININVGSVVLTQTMIYNGLANVNSALKNGIAVKNMAVTITDMIAHLQDCIELARSDPYLLLFATGIEHEIQLRALALVTDVSGYVLKSGSNVLADYNSRDQLLRKVTQELQILDSLAYGAWRAMYWAKERGIIASLNPWAAYINRDKNFVNQIIQNAKYLHR